MRVLSILASILLATACATDSPVARSTDESDTGSRIVLVSEGAPPLVLRPSPRRAPVEVSRAEYEAAMVRYARELRDEFPPLPSKRLEVISWGSPEQRDERDQQVQDYLQWCDERGTPGDCLHLLEGRRHLDDEARRQLAFALATEGVWQGTAAVLDEVLDPVQLQIALMGSITTTFILLAAPEPISKVLIISITLGLVVYVGWDTLAGLIDGWKRMDEEARQARTFSELRVAGERYGRVMGEKVTRLLILVATAALGGAGGKAINPGGKLPGFAQASRLAAAEGVPVQVVGQVKTVKVTGRILTVAMEPNVLLMANRGMGSGGGDAPRSSPRAPRSSGSKYRLTSVESWRKPRFTEDGRILPFKQTREPASPIPNLGRSRTGQTVTNGKATVRFDKDGFPEFDTPFETLIDDVHIGSGRPDLHIKAANRNLHDAIKSDPGLAQTLKLNQTQVDNLLSIYRAPEGYVWHHHQDVGRLQLILQDSHFLARPHTGGMAIWGGGY